MQALQSHSDPSTGVISPPRHPAPRPVCRAAAAAGQQHQQQRTALLYDFHDQLIPYDKAWSWQKQRVAELCSADGTQDTRDTVFLLQHPPVYTLGAGSSEEHVKFDLQHPPHPLYRTERGGEVTYHGPGQLVMYPILNLNHHTQDLHWYLRGLEEVIIRALADTSGLQGQRVQGMTGVWVDGHKLAAIGVRARKWVTYHGLALNVTTDLQPFQWITPCGIADKPVGSVKSALRLQQQQHPSGSSISTGTGSSSSSCSSRSAGIQQQQQQQQLDSIVRDPLITEYRYALLEALEGVFGLQLQPASQQQLEQLLQHQQHQQQPQQQGGADSSVQMARGSPAGDSYAAAAPAAAAAGSVVKL